MPGSSAAKRTIQEREGIQMTPAQLNDVVESNLMHLKPALEDVYSEMLRLKDDLANGKFDVKRLVKRAWDKSHLL
ncbi:MAG: hypothetical protein DRJ03_01760 [Chloroflexi bacterium]|nr:MAG: hypothetical protein DRJ03_01760 [Chloroflexota bacterium]